MGLTIHDIDKVESNARSFIWTCLVAAAQNNNLEVCGNYLDGLLEEAGVKRSPFPSRVVRLEEMDQKVNLMGATYMQVTTNLVGESPHFLLRLPPVPTYKGIVIYADTLPPLVMTLITSYLEESGYDFLVDTGHPSRMDNSPQPSIAIGDACTAHLLRVGRGLNTILVSLIRPSYTALTVYDRAIELFTPLHALSDKGVNWSDGRTHKIVNERMSKLMPIVDHFLGY